MFRRLFTCRRLIIAASLSPILLSAAVSPQLLSVAIAKPASQRLVSARDWTKFPAIVQLDTTADIAAIGDVHGDYKRLVNLLAAAKLIPGVPQEAKEIRWSGGKTTLVCTGDLIDKGDRSLDVIACFRLLQQQAADAGGCVLVTLGNHEAEFLDDPEDDEKALEFLKELEAAGLDPTDVAEGRDAQGAGAFIRSLPFAVRINDWFFAHACNTDGVQLAALEAALRVCVDKDGYGAKILSRDDSIVNARLHPLPWWERQDDIPQQSESRLRGYAQALGVKHLVMGHQPGKVHFSDGSKRHPGQLIQKFDGLIFLIDVGMSRAIDHSKGAVLWIHPDSGRGSARLIDHDGTSELLWPK